VQGVGFILSGDDAAGTGDTPLFYNSVQNGGL
jgi:hypothetical protein